MTAFVCKQAYKGVLAVLVTFAIAGITGNAFANTITPTSSPVITGAGPYTWTYSVNLTGNSTINTGDYFAIFDFFGFVAASNTQPAGWTFSSSPTTVCPAGVGGVCTSFDDPGVVNLTWTWTGAPITNVDLVEGTPLGSFAAVSTSNIPRNDWFISQDDDNQTGTPNEGSAGNTNVPTPTPEPTSLLLLGSGLAALGLVRRKMSR